MRFTLFLFTILLGFTTSAHTITVKILEGWKSTPIENSEVILKSSMGRILETGTSDANGIVVFEKVKNGKHSISATDDSGNFVNTSVSLKVNAKSDNEVQIILRPTDAYVRDRKDEEDKIYGTVDPRKISTDDEIDSLGVDAAFPGGTLKMSAYIQENVVYPEISRDLGDQGRVYVEFIIEPDGVITHVSFLRAVTEELEQEAMRLVRSMPNWIPGMQNGETIRARCTLPITFILQ